MRLIDADELSFASMLDTIDQQIAEDTVANAPTVDAVPVIRCKDCKHWSADDNETYCEELGIFGTGPNSFCSFARKKEEPTMEEFMQGQDLGDPEDGSL